jgi:hypothetical protein
MQLRAHDPTNNGRLTGRLVGRHIASAGLAVDLPVYRTGPVVLAAGVFLDAARVVHTADGSRDNFYLDGGAGLRIGLADGQLGVLRIDLARALRTDSQSAITVGVHRNWPFIRHGYD